MKINTNFSAINLAFTYFILCHISVKKKLMSYVFTNVVFGHLEKFQIHTTKYM